MFKNQLNPFLKLQYIDKNEVFTQKIAKIGI